MGTLLSMSRFRCHETSTVARLSPGSKFPLSLGGVSDRGVLDMVAPSPVNGIVGDRGMEAGREEEPLDVVAAVALLEEGQRDAAGPSTGIGVGSLGELCLGPFGVHGLKPGREPAQVPPV